MAGAPHKGFALVLVLWVLVLITTMGLAFALNVRTDSRAAIGLTEQVQLRAAADAAIARTIADLTERDPQDVPLRFGVAYEMPWPGANLRVTMISESAKIDLNYAPRPLLVGLFRQRLPEASAESLADAVIDWRDRDERRSPEGAEAADYRAAGLSVTPANRPFQSVSELTQVLGFDAAAVAQISPHVTVYARRPRIDPYSADATVLAAVPGLDADKAAAFIAYRDTQQAAGEPVRLDTLGGGIRYLERRPSRGAVRIRAVANTDGGRTLSREAVIRLAGGNSRYQVLDWRQRTAEAD